MNCLCFERGEIATLYCSFVALAGKEPTTITDPKITISHVDGSGTFVIDIFEVTMLLANENNYYYQWNIPEAAFVGFYNVECEAFLDGDYAESNETIKVN